ncbi:hypothetical protein GLOIN_2v1881647 [Rhizophagus clarus]|uniref:Uncharacterized protein n=1 Tax=Rhizophagus clarus TaxID=94130 RepID=A0A8H3QCE0_9GLOM|nr:hypothetical protein GLOIN_2v1881647 [Rhizophagus clarus]
MFRVNRDILYLIFFKELQNDKNIPYSCLSVNNTRFCKHLNFIEIERIIDICMKYQGNQVILVKNEIINAFINEKTRFTHLYLPQQFVYQIHLIPGAEQCFSNLKFLYCKTNVDEKVLIGLTEICKSITRLELFIEKFNNNYGIVKFIEASFVSIPVLTSLIENTKGYLRDINIQFINHSEINNKRIIQAIYQNCPNLLYLKILYRNSSTELENLLINCQRLIGLFFIISDLFVSFNWKDLFEVLTRLSPTSLFKFSFSNCYREISLEALKFFFDNWKEKYKAKGIIKKFNYNTWYEQVFKDFEWI